MINDAINSGFNIPDEQKAIAAQYEVGFKFGEKGAHTSRTIMLDEITLLLRSSKPDATRGEYRVMITEENCLGKRTAATRKLTDQRLSELYALDAKVLLFRIIRQLWGADEGGRPLLAMLLALARDPLLRSTATPIMQLHHGNEFSRKAFTDILNKCTGSRFNEAVVDKIVRNTASSWTQSGHLEGRTFKIRQTVRPTPAVATFALLMGYILGARGDVLFETLWAKILDISKGELIQIASDAKRLGYLDIKASGGIVEVSFYRLLTDEERRLIHGTD